jgi:hypothetical protein
LAAFIKFTALTFAELMYVTHGQPSAESTLVVHWFVGWMVQLLAAARAVLYSASSC